MVPFLRFGEAISGGPHFPLTSDALKKVLTGQASREVILSIAHAVGSQLGSIQLSCSISHVHIGRLRTIVLFFTFYCSLYFVAYQE